jgi:hypothetical protein
MILIYGVTPIIKQLLCHIIDNPLGQAFKSRLTSCIQSWFRRIAPVPPYGFAGLSHIRVNPAVQI